MARNATSSNTGKDLFAGSGSDVQWPDNNAIKIQLGGRDDASYASDEANAGRSGSNGDGKGAGTLIAIVHVGDRGILSSDDFLDF